MSFRASYVLSWMMIRGVICCTGGETKAGGAFLTGTGRDSSLDAVSWRDAEMCSRRERADDLTRRRVRKGGAASNSVQVSCGPRRGDD